MRKTVITFICFILVLITLTTTLSAQAIGDSNNDGAVDIVDALIVAQYFVGLSPSGFIVSVSDVNDDGAVDIADSIYLLQHLFGSGSDLPSPYPDCGIDPTLDDLDCLEYEPCRL